MTPSQQIEQDQCADVFVARQPIFRRDLSVWGYELLYRGSLENSFDGSASDAATAKVIMNAFVTIGADKLLNNKKALVNFDAAMLELEYATLLPFKAIVVEILESVKPEESVLEACRKMKKKGYTFALDDITDESRIEPWLGIVDIAKVDFSKTSAAMRKQLAVTHKKKGLLSAAEKVETYSDFEAAVSLHYDLFQGYFLGNPTIVTGRAIPDSQITLVRILREVSLPELDMRRVEKLIEREVPLVFKLLKCVNSAAFGWRHKIKSVRHAIALLGQEELRKWICLLVIGGLGKQKPAELMAQSLIRARFGELLSPKARLGSRKDSMFLLGLLSNIGAILNRTMSEALAELSLEEDLTQILLGNAAPSDPLGQLFGLTTAYVSADWVRAFAIAQSMRIETSQMTEAYVKSVEWVDLVMRM